MKRILLISFLLLSSLVTQAWAQERTVSGKITSAEDGSGLPGVNVVLKGTTTGTVSDIDGNYKLSIPDAGGVLVYSFIGLQTQEVTVGAQSVIDVSMSADVTQLTEVVVTAVGIERERKSLGYSVTSLSADDIAQRSEPDPVRALQGQVAGVNMQLNGGAAGGATNINIRGNSLTAGGSGANQPLFVVDGVPFDNSTYATQGFANGASTYTNRAFDIDPNNIESINVLKGAAASALYGSRAAGGVIVITTKSGKSGVRSNKGLEMTFNASYAIEEVANLIEIQETYTQGAEFSYNGGFVGTWGARYSDLGPVAHPLDQDRLAAAFPEFQGQTVNLAPRNNAEEFYRTGEVIETGLQVRSTTDKTTLTAGFNRSDNTGIVPFNSITRNSITMGGNAELDNGFYIAGNINYVNVENRGPQLGTPLSGNSTSITERLLFTPPNYDLAGYPFINPIDGSSVYYRTDQDNPMWVAQENPFFSKVDRYYGNITLRYDILEWLSVTYRAGFNAYTDRRQDVIAASSVANPQGRILEDNIYNEELNGDLIITANRDLNEDFSLQVLLGHNINQRTGERQAFRGDGIIVRGIYDLDNTTTQINAGGTNFQRRIIGAFAEATLGYKDWAFLIVGGRNDWSSTLPKENRSFFYPSASLSFVFTEALNLQSNAISSGKLRVSIARVGADAGPYNTLNTFNINGGPNSNALGSPFINPFSGNPVNTVTESTALANSALEPEFTTEFEVGGEFSFLNNRIALDVAYYDRSSTSLITAASVAPSSGFLSRIVNIGEITNRGIEAKLDLVPVQLDNGFTWNLTTLFTRNRNEIVSLTDGLEQIIPPGGGFTNLAIVHRPGLPFGQILGSDILRDEETGLPLINPESGLMIDDPTLRIIGDPNPNFQMTFTNRFSWKGLSLSFQIDYTDGGDLFSFSTAQSIGRGVAAFTEDREWSRVITGFLGDPETGQPLLDESGNKIPNNIAVTANEFFFIDGVGSAGADVHNVYDATVIRLRSITLAYSFPNSILSKTPFGSASISFSGRNLWYNAPNFPEGMNIDPEISSLLGGTTGLDFSTVPTTKRYGVNLRVTF